MEHAMHSICRLQELADPGSREFRVGGGDWPFTGFVVRRGDRVFAYRNYCMHVGHPLNWKPDEFLTRDRRHIICALIPAIACEDPVLLGTAVSFGVLAGSTVTNTGVTLIEGDLGVSPGTAITGFPPGVVSGTIHSADAVADQAKLDLVTAYDDAAGRAGGAAMDADIGGETLTPGVYTSASAVAISSGDLTLDAGGDPSKTFIFQIGSTLITDAGRQIILSGGAQAQCIFWQVGSSATLGTNSVFKGTIVALTSISVTTGANVDGRVLARNGAVTLDQNTVTIP